MHMICIIRTYFHACKIIDCTGLSLREPCHQLIECSRKLRSCVFLKAKTRGLLVTVSLLRPLDVKLCVFLQVCDMEPFWEKAGNIFGKLGIQRELRNSLGEILGKSLEKESCFWKGPGWSQSL